MGHSSPPVVYMGDLHLPQENLLNFGVLLTFIRLSLPLVTSKSFLLKPTDAMNGAQ